MEDLPHRNGNRPVQGMQVVGERTDRPGPSKARFG